MAELKLVVANTAKETDMKNWSETRRMGKSAYVWKVWVFCWGLGTAVIFSIIINFIQPANSGAQLPLLGFIVFPVTGFFAGNLTWALTEKKHGNDKTSKDA